MSEGSVFLVEASQTDDFTEYTIEVHYGGYFWRVKHRYSEFKVMHDELRLKHPVVEKNLLPPKKLFGKMSPSFVDKRKKELESYLQSLLNKRYSNGIPLPLRYFLHFHLYDVETLCQFLAEKLFKIGDGILMSGGSFTFSTVELWAITERISLQKPHTDSENPNFDFGHVLDFLQKLKYLHVICERGYVGSSNIRAEELVFDLSLFRSLQQLVVDGCSSDQAQSIAKLRHHLTALSVHQSISDIQTLLTGGYHLVGDDESWNRLITADFSDNDISKIDSSVKLLTTVEFLDLSKNKILKIENLQYLTGLTFLDLSQNLISEFEFAHARLGNVKTLILAKNKLKSLEGLGKLYALETLDVSNNLILELNEIDHIANLPCLSRLNLSKNSVTLELDYRTQTLAKFAIRSSEVYLDETPSSQKELDTAAVLHAISKSKKISWRSSRSSYDGSTAGKKRSSPIEIKHKRDFEASVFSAPGRFCLTPEKLDNSKENIILSDEDIGSFSTQGFTDKFGSYRSNVDSLSEVTPEGSSNPEENENEKQDMVRHLDVSLDKLDVEEQSHESSTYFSADEALNVVVIRNGSVVNSQKSKEDWSQAIDDQAIMVREFVEDLIHRVADQSYAGSVVSDVHSTLESNHLSGVDVSERENPIGCENGEKVMKILKSEGFSKNHDIISLKENHFSAKRSPHTNCEKLSINKSDHSRADLDFFEDLMAEKQKFKDSCKKTNSLPENISNLNTNFSRTRVQTVPFTGDGTADITLGVPINRFSDETQDSWSCSLIVKSASIGSDSEKEESSCYDLEKFKHFVETDNEILVSTEKLRDDLVTVHSSLSYFRISVDPLLNLHFSSLPLRHLAMLSSLYCSDFKLCHLHDQENVLFVTWSDVVFYNEPNKEIPAAIFLTNQAVHFVVDTPSVFDPSIHRTLESLNGLRIPSRSSQCRFPFDKFDSKISQIMIGLFGQCVRIAGSKPEHVATLVMRSSYLVESFVLNLVGALRETSTTTNDVKKLLQFERNLFNDEITLPYSNVIVSICNEQAMMEFNLTTVELRTQYSWNLNSSPKLLLYLLVHLINSNLKQSKSFLLTSQFCCLCDENLVSYPIPHFETEAPLDLRYRDLQLVPLSELICLRVDAAVSYDVSVVLPLEKEKQNEVTEWHLSFRDYRERDFFIQAICHQYQVVLGNSLKIHCDRS